MSEVICESCSTEGDHPSRIICDACLFQMRRTAKCCLDAQAENKQLKEFLGAWNGHDPDCGRNREGFPGHDETMFNCDCGYEEAKRQALKPDN